MGPAAFALGLVGVLAMCAAVFGPAAVYETGNGVAPVGQYYFFGDTSRFSVSGFSLFPQFALVALLVIAFGTTGARRTAARIGAIMFGALALAVLGAALLTLGDRLDEGRDLSPGWGAYVMGAAILLLIASAATTFEPGPGRMRQVAQPGWMQPGWTQPVAQPAQNPLVPLPQQAAVTVPQPSPGAYTPVAQQAAAPPAPAPPAMPPALPQADSAPSADPQPAYPPPPGPVSAPPAGQPQSP